MMRRTTTRLVLVICAVVLATAVGFLIHERKLDRADSWASIGSFVLALLALSASLIAAVARRGDQDSGGRQPAPAQPAPPGNLYRADNMQVGNQNTMNVRDRNTR